MTYKFVDSSALYPASCVNLSGAGILFAARQAIETGKALEIFIEPDGTRLPPVNAFIEVLRCSRNAESGYKVAGSIKGIKAR